MQTKEDLSDEPYNASNDYNSDTDEDSEYDEEEEPASCSSARRNQSHELAAVLTLLSLSLHLLFCTALTEKIFTHRIRGKGGYMAYKKLGYGKFLSMFVVIKRLSWRRRKQLCCWQLFLSHCLAGISMFYFILLYVWCVSYKTCCLLDIFSQGNGGDIYICEGCHLQ